MHDTYNAVEKHPVLFTAANFHQHAKNASFYAPNAASFHSVSEFQFSNLEAEAVCYET